MFLANRNSELKQPATPAVTRHRCGRPLFGLCLGLLIATVVLASVAVFAAPPGKPASSRFVIGNPRGTPVRSNPVQLGGDIDDEVPISRIVPRAKTIQPVEEVRRSPLGSDDANVQQVDEREAEEQYEEYEEEPPETEASEPEDDIDAEDLRSPARQDARNPSDVRWSSETVRQRPRRAPLPVAARLTEPTGEAPTRDGRSGEGSTGDGPIGEGPIGDRAPFLGQGDGMEPLAPIAEQDSSVLPPEGGEYVIDEPWPQDPAGYDLSCPPQGVNDCHCWGPLKKFLYFNQTNGDIGIGHERVMFAPFEIETSQPANNFRLKMMDAFDLRTPDRAEYIWAKIGGPGPTLPENSVNYQNFDAIYEAGGNRFSFVTDIPLRYVHPDNNVTGAGIGNISLAPKVVIVSGNDWQISSIFRTYLPTGAASRGTSTGFLSLEPGVLVRYRWSPRTFVHSQLKYWVPITGDPIASGNVFNYGLGVSHVMHETDTFAIIPVIEAIGWTVGGGTATLPTGVTTSANTTFVNLQPGVRFVLGPKGDLGLCEFGVSGGFCTDVTGWYREQLTVEFRWSW